MSLPSHPKVERVPAPRPPRTEGIDAFLDRLQKETLQPTQFGKDSRSKTFPVRKDSADTVDTTNQSALSPDGIKPSTSPPRAKNTFPMRSTSRAGSRAGIRPDGLAPPMPPIATLERNISSKPLHTPSDSGLSDDSMASSGFQSTVSSRSSPATSASGYSRTVSKSSRIDSPTEDNVGPYPGPEKVLESTSLPPSDIRNNPMGYKANAPGPLLPTISRPFINGPESPMDPAIQRGLLHSPFPSKSQDFRKPNELPLSKSPVEQIPNTDSRAAVNRRPTTAVKGKCRGCSKVITGRSIKAADGRLTGRYHKECFVCQTCRAPFKTADFYVFDNFPYCELHYHQLNGSLCKSCGRGIEGAYLETDQRQKFHPKCFTCTTCRIVLRDDYFELGGKPFCERHAYHASAQQNSFLGPGGPGRRNPERRTTRLMMMI